MPKALISHTGGQHTTIAIQAIGMRQRGSLSKCGVTFDLDSRFPVFAVFESKTRLFEVAISSFVQGVLTRIAPNEVVKAGS